MDSGKILNDLPAIIYKTLVDDHLSDLEVKTLRLVSKETRSWIDNTISILRPRDFSKPQVTTHKRIPQVTYTTLPAPAHWTGLPLPPPLESLTCTMITLGVACD